MSIGLKRGEVSVENHQIEWEVSAKNTIDILKNTLNNDIVDAQHIGSTSIKSICAKPIIDIVVGVKDFKDILKNNDELNCIKELLLLCKNNCKNDIEKAR